MINNFDRLTEINNYNTEINTLRISYIKIYINSIFIFKYAKYKNHYNEIGHLRLLNGEWEMVYLRYLYTT